MTQTFIVLAVVALALCWCLWHIVRTLQGKRDCGCGQGKHCQHRHAPRNGRQADLLHLREKQAEKEDKTSKT